jgi:hypothetical protein
MCHEKIRFTKLGLAVVAVFSIWFSVVQPLIASAILLFGIVTIAFYVLSLGLEQVSALLTPVFFRRGRRIPGWQMTLGGVVAALVILPQAEPAQAQFFNSLETGLKAVIADSGSGIDEGIITTIFVFFRVLVVLAFVTGVIISLTLAMRGGEWQPLLNVIGIGVAFVVAVEVISVLILGAAATAGGGAGGGGAGGGAGG